MNVLDKLEQHVWDNGSTDNFSVMIKGFQFAYFINSLTNGGVVAQKQTR